ncbi:MAG: hypothetical protein Q4C22_02465 [Bacillota bacterium]|nr:hypothetical protein [Bacillota bacterium]
MAGQRLVLGIDTSNYTTSAALTDAETGEIAADLRKPLAVKKGERGLRQSEALFQHMENLPELLAAALEKTEERGSVAAVAASSQPRRTETSYMPVFRAGLQFARTLSAALKTPLFCFSHQEGHLAAAAHDTPLAGEKKLLAWHLSGGTCELLFVKEEGISIIGGSRDISAGQLIDRTGVAMGLDFPAGPAMDRLALSVGPLAAAAELKPIFREGTWANLSGTETQALRLWAAGETKKEELAGTIFARLADCIAFITEQGAAETGCKKVLFAGGVSASVCLRGELQSRLEAAGLQAVFGAPALMGDNAVGTALLGGEALWR